MTMTRLSKMRRWFTLALTYFLLSVVSLVYWMLITIALKGIYVGYITGDDRSLYGGYFFLSLLLLSFAGFVYSILETYALGDPDYSQY